MKKPETNSEFIHHFMEHGSAMNQIFVIDALNKQAKIIVDNEEEVLGQMKGGFVHGPAWVQAAKDFLKQSEEFYNRKL